MSGAKKITLLFFLFTVPVLIYCYFLPWKTHSIHDDDLFIVRNYTDRHGFFERLNLSNDFGQFRPVRDLFLHFEMQVFGKNTDGVYFVNVLVQSINTFLFAFILNLVFRSLLLSFGFSIIYALSRFSFYNLTQLYNGAPLEGLAVTFFLLCLYQVIRTAILDENAHRQHRRQILMSILFANLAIYTHERYITLFPFLLLFVLFFPSIKLNWKNKIALSALVALSPVVNGMAKTFFSLRIFMGTAYRDVKFSLTDAVQHYFTELLSIFQFNFGAEYLVGWPYERLTQRGQWLVMVSTTVIGLLFILFVVHAFVSYIKKKNAEPAAANEHKKNLMLFVYLFILMSLLIGPAVVQIRMELRWLQAPLCVFLLMIAITMTRLFNQKKVLQLTSYLVILVSYLYTNYHYVYNGSKNLYYSTAARIGDTFDAAIKTGAIQTGKTKLYIWEKRRDEGREGEVNWALNKGHFFELYQEDTMQLVFIDSVYSCKKDSLYAWSFPNFDSGKEQIIFLDIENDDQTFTYKITNLTSKYFADSLKVFSTHYN